MKQLENNVNINKKASSAETDKADNMGRETGLEPAAFRATICQQNDIISINNNILQDTTHHKVTKYCPNSDKNGISTNTNNQKEKPNTVTEAVLTINSLPLTDNEKADMIRLLLNSYSGKD